VAQTGDPSVQSGLDGRFGQPEPAASLGKRKSSERV